MSNHSTAPIAVQLTRPTHIATNIALILGGAVFTAILAQIAIPTEPVPYTLQTAAVLITGFALGSKRGLASMLAYLTAGAVGLPVFSNFMGGAHILFGDTGGYLVSFAVAAWLMGWFSERGWDRNFFKVALALLAGNAVIFALGWAWLSVYVGMQAAFSFGVVPFLATNGIQSLGVAAALPAAGYVADKIRPLGKL